MQFKLMQEKALKITTASILLLSLGACTIISPVIRDRGQDYKKAHQGAELKLPASVQANAKSNRYDIPKVDMSKPTVSHKPPGIGEVPW